MPVPGAELAGVHYLRTLADSDALAARLQAGGRVVVIGAGWIGAEVAASARQAGLDVAIVERERMPLERVLGSDMGCFFGELHRDRGVAVHTGQTVEALEGDGAVEAVRLGDGRELPCDFVVVGIGVAPRVALAEAAGLEVQNGILVDGRLETSAPGVFAAGDVANVMHPFYGTRVRVEHWANALHQPEVAAPAMLGKPATWDRLPYFFSDQYELGMEYTGPRLARRRGRAARRAGGAGVHCLLAGGGSGRRGDERQRLGRRRCDLRADSKPRGRRPRPAGRPRRAAGGARPEHGRVRHGPAAAPTER